MANQTVKIGDLADAVMSGLAQYADLATSSMKAAVKKSAKSVKDEISASAPKQTGKYAKSWGTKVTKESANTLEVTVHSRNRYQIAHLLEHGHAKRNGGRVSAQPHIGQAEQRGVAALEDELERSLEHG